MNISVIMAVFNEEKFLPKALNALMQQTLRPNQIIVVDDGSTDRSPQIINQYPVTKITLPVKKTVSLQRYPIVLSVGSRHINPDFDYVAILDADILIESTYYQKLVAHMQKDPAIGIAGGELIGQPAGPALGLMPYVYGANRLYTRNCWLKLNHGKTLQPIPQIDFYHNIYAEMLGYKTQRFSDIKSWALRPTRLGNPFLRGYHAYEFGYDWLYLILRALRNRAPTMIAGYLKARFSDRPEYPIKPYVRKLQRKRLRKILRG